MPIQPANPNPPEKKPPAQEAVAPPPGLPQISGLSFDQFITDVESSKFPKSAAFLGLFKVGKTTLLASSRDIPGLAESSTPGVLIIEAEGGTASVASKYPGVKQLVIQNAVDFDNVINELCLVPHRFGVVGVDTFDRFQEYKLQQLLAMYPGDTRLAYGELKKWTIDIAWRLHWMPALAILLFHEEGVKNDLTGEITTTYSLAGSAGKSLGQVFDIIGRLQIDRDPATGDPVRALQLGPRPGDVTGSRYEAELPNRMLEPTMAKIIEAINNPATSSTNN